MIPENSRQVDAASLLIQLAHCVARLFRNVGMPRLTLPKLGCVRLKFRDANHMVPVPKSAVLLRWICSETSWLSMAREFPVGAGGAEAVLQMANAILSKKLIPEALPILVVNQFAASAQNSKTSFAKVQL